MILDNIDELKVTDVVTLQCDECGDEVTRTLKRVKRSRKVRNSEKDFCIKCSRKLGALKRPQNSKEFWDKNKQSDAYYKGIANRPDITGENNPMWMKEHTLETKKKMSIARTGKTGENATAWKGGKLSFNRRVKSALQRNFRWFHRVMERDGCICQECGATKNLDAHHIIPISTIITELLIDKESLTESEKMDWIMTQPSIIDENLENGKTLCRTCHKKIHTNWGSHEPKVQ